MKIKTTSLSFLLSLIGIILTIAINYKIYIAYTQSNGKDRAFFGLTVALQFGYQYYITIFGILGTILAVMAYFKTDQKKQSVYAFLTGLFAIAIVFAEIWRILI